MKATTDRTGSAQRQDSKTATMFFDGGCPLCSKEVGHYMRVDKNRNINWVDIHANPELSNREFETSKRIASELRALGIEVRTGIAHTGVVGVLRGARPGPVVAIRADMDALPVTERSDLPFRSTATAEYEGATVGVAHACGHDIHMSVVLGTAMKLAVNRSSAACAQM